MISATSIHEAGHAWAYWRSDLPLRYITIRPSDPTAIGVCRPWRPRMIPISTMAVIASAGPIAQAVLTQEGDDQGLDWEDYLLGAVMAGGSCDLDKAAGMLDDQDSTAALRTAMLADWPALLALATALDESKTIPGRAAFQLLADSLRTEGARDA